MLTDSEGDHVDPALALRGFVLGFTIAAAVGPISLLVIRRTLAEGRLYGLVSGLGVATADATYGAIAAFGLGGRHRRRSSTPGRCSAWSAASSCCGWPGRRSGRRRPRPRRSPTRRRGLRRCVPVDPRADDGQPDDDPVVRGPVRRARRHERRDGRRGARRPRRAARLDDVVGRPDDGRRDAADAGHAGLDPSDQPRVRACLIGAFAIVAIASVLVGALRT